ncbi:hypothetical protein MKX03_009332 [Papaver bracteatum]|nr:hypothetical protein MKX03_009332 [Papaver bracteatum]
MEEDQGMLSMVSSNITTLNGEEGCSDFNSSNSLPGSPSNSHQSRRDISVTSSPPARFKSVVLLPNGSWDTQIYANRKRTWIGTFKSESDAGKAYDAAAVKLRKSGDSPRNCPLTSSTLASSEPNFQKLLTIDEIKNMLKDGSYQTKLYEFANSCSLDNEPGLSLSLGSAAAMDGDVKYQQLFQKALRPSDVGKLNRLVIPKEFAEKYFPDVSKEAIQLSFFDREMKSWNFRYCYWNSSQSYVFTNGWIRFVKEKKLKAHDVVTFYKCDCQKEAQKAFYVIDVASSVAPESNGGGFAGGFDTDAGNNRVDLQLGIGQSTTINESGPSDRTIKLRQQKEVALPQPEEEKKKCESQNGAQKAFHIIDLASVAAETNGGFHTDAGNRVNLQLCLGQITVNESGASDRTIKLRQHKEVAPPQPDKEDKKSVRLFGVNIS